MLNIILHHRKENQNFSLPMEETEGEKGGKQGMDVKKRKPLATTG